MVDCESMYHGFASTLPQNNYYFLFFYFYFFIIIFFIIFIFCHYYYRANSTLLSLLRFSYFSAPYDSQASSACSILNNSGDDLNKF